MKEQMAAIRKRQITRVYIYIMLIAFPLFTGFSGYTNITASKLAFYLVATLLWLLLLIAVSVYYRSFRVKPLSSALICLLIYFALCCASAIFSPYKSVVLLGAGRFDGLLAVFLSVAVFAGVSRNAAHERGYIFALTASMTLCCVVALLQLLNINALGLFPGDFSYYDMGIKYSGEFLGTIGNANLFSAFLCLCLSAISVFFIRAGKARYYLAAPILLAAFCLFECSVSAGKLALLLCLLIAAPFVIRSREDLRRAWLIMAVLFLALVLSSAFDGLRTDSQVRLFFRISVRATAFMAISAVFFLLFIVFRRDIRFHRRRFLIVYGILVLVALVAAIVFIYNYSGSEGTLYELSRILHGELLDSFGSSRILIWRETLGLAVERPLLGGGPGTTAHRLDIEFSRFVEETGKTLSSRVDNAHNVYLGILADTGIASLLAYFAAMALTLRRAVRSSRRRTTVLALSCGLLSYWIQDFFGLGLFIVSPVMFIVWGLACSRRLPDAVQITEDAAIGEEDGLSIEKQEL